jgi:beta-glucosidase
VPEFLWGAATSGHQTEGWNTNSDWWEREQTGSPLVTEPSGDATDSYHRWPQDMDLLAQAGFTDYRFGVEWARIEPAPGELSVAQLDHYERMVDGALERGLRPLVTLNHFSVPRWFAQAGGWRAPQAAERFGRYVTAVAPRLAGRVRHVCTINEPLMVALLAAVEGRRCEPGDLQDDILNVRPDPAVSDSLTEAHRLARTRLRDIDAGFAVGWSMASVNVYSDPSDDEAVDEYVVPRETVFLEASAADDWVGVQAYARRRVGRIETAVRALPLPDGVECTLNGWEYYPPALGDAIRRTAKVVGSVPIIVTENGIATEDDTRRIDYTSGALASMAAAMDGGADVRGYFHWSLLDNYEWGSFRPTFGLVGVDGRTFARTPKPSLAWLATRRGDFTSRPTREESHTA